MARSISRTFHGSDLSEKLLGFWYFAGTVHVTVGCEEDDLITTFKFSFLKSSGALEEVWDAVMHAGLSPKISKEFFFSNASQFIEDILSQDGT